MLPPAIMSKMEPSERTDIVMPKMKTKSSAKKRFRVRPGGTVKRGQAFKRHILTKKTTKNKRQLRGAVPIAAADHTAASVVRLVIFSVDSRFKIIPAPRKPIPDTI